MLSSKKKINNRLVAGIKDRNKVIGSMLSSINCISFHFKWKSEHSTPCGKQNIPPCVGNRATSSGQNPSFHFVWKSEHSTSSGKQNIPPRVENKLSTSCGQSFLFPPCVGTLSCFTKTKNLNPIQTKIITSQSHQCSNVQSNLIHDIETNPGPGDKLKIIAINCRGFWEIEKFRLLLNKAYDMMQKGKMIMMIKGTMITNSRYLDLAWRGKYVFTPGTGNSQGCITLTHNEVTITDIEHIQNSGRYFKSQMLIINKH